MTLNNKKEEKFKRMTPFTHPAQKIYQVDTGHQEQEPKTFKECFALTSRNKSLHDKENNTVF